MNYGSICSGIEAASVAWEPLGWECQFLSEIDAFPRAVLQYRFPHIPLHGDFTTIQRGDYGAISLLVGGTPCQSFSVAGLRKGLEDPRGNLMLGFGALAERLRPQWLVWENVPGVLSNNEGRDFGTFLGMLGQLGYGFAYRVLDAQYVRVESHSRAVPQRRRRVFVVGYLGDWRPAAAVLFERESLCGHPAPRREKGQRVAPGVTGGPPFSRTGNERIEDEAMIEICPCIPASGRGFERTGDTRGQDAVIAVTGPLMYGQHGMNTQQDAESGYVVPVAFAFNGDQSEKTRSMGEREELCPTIRSDGPCHVAQVQWSSGGGQVENDTAQALRSGAEHNYQFLRTNMAVRRLTPRECERLQGFPDDFTLIPYRGKMAADGPRYKALGNSMAVNVMRWIGQRIRDYEERNSSKLQQHGGF